MLQLKIKISVRLNLFMFGSCFRTLEVILFQTFVSAPDQLKEERKKERKKKKKKEEDKMNEYV